MDLLQAFKEHWQRNFAHCTTANAHLLLAVSGGVDSIVLTELIAKSGFDFTILHVNFQLRGADSERDELFVGELGKKYEKSVVVQKFETNSYVTENGIAIQEAARNLRYQWFQDYLLMQQLTDVNKKYLILTAHHADDNIETVLMNFFRGTGIQGMRGILPFQKDRSLLRPLLPFKKEMLFQWAKENALDFVEDSSNQSTKYTRNFFRNQLIPEIQQVFPQAPTNILQNIDRFKEVADIYQESIDARLKLLMESKGNEWHIPLLKLKQSNYLSTIIWELIKQFGFSANQISEVIKLMDAGNGSHLDSASHQIIRNRKWLVIAPIETKQAVHIVIEQDVPFVAFQLGSIEINLQQQLNIELSTDPLHAMLDAKMITFPMLLRKVQTSDYFYPLGLGKKKKISRFLNDQKLSRTAKDQVWVLESNQKIIWVIGLRIDDRFKISTATKQLLSLRLKAN